MRVAIITDTHSGAGNDNQHLNEYFLQFYEKLFFPYLKERKIEHVIHLGDTFDRRKYVNFNTLHSWHTRVFQPLSDMCERVDILIGNHDCYFKNTNQVNSVDELLSKYKNFHSYIGTTEVTVGGRKILYVPWICEDNTEHSLRMISESDATVCMGHLELIGFEMYAGHINADKGMGSGIFEKFDMTLSGHFHQKSSMGNIHYLGAPYPMMWGDYGSPRGFHVLDTEKMKLSFVPNDDQMFHKIQYDDSKATLEELLSKDFAHLAGRFVKVIVQNKQNPYWFEQVFEKLQKSNPADLSVIDAAIDISNHGDVEVEEAKDTMTILRECVDSCSDVPSQRSALNDLLREIYVEALNSNEYMQSNG